jgi:putative inorganic carbon (HCO3(-)) transporter
VLKLLRIDISHGRQSRLVFIVKESCFEGKDEGAIMRDGHGLSDYEAVKPLRRGSPRGVDSPEPFRVARADSFAGSSSSQLEVDPAPAQGKREPSRKEQKRLEAAAPTENWSTRRGHFVTYIGLFLFTAFVFFRPYELFSISWLAWGTELAAIFTLVAYFPTQLAEGNLTAQPREIKFALLLLLTALLSVPFAISPGEAWDNFVEFSKVILMFVVMVNVVRTERRLRGLLMLAMAVSLMLSYAAFHDFSIGKFAYGGERVKGMLGGLFDNPNDLAIHLVTMAPIALGLALARRGVWAKVFYLSCAILFLAGVVVSFSRGGFLGLVAATFVIVWKLGRKNRFVVATLTAVALTIFIAVSPGGYGSRITSMFTGDATGSATARRDVFWRSAQVALRYPLFGIGLGNFYYKGQHDQVSHNAYTQVAAEMGMAALVFYCMFMVTSLKRLRQIERESFAHRDRARFYYLAIGLQASLVAYMVSSFFASVAHLWYVYYIVGYAVSLRRLYALQYGTSLPAGSPAVATDGEFPHHNKPHAEMA